MGEVSTIGLDIAKSVFQVHDLNPAQTTGRSSLLIPERVG